VRALIVLGGDAPGKALLRACAKEADWTIAADRGLEAFDAADVEPDLLIGDMDSIRPDILATYEGKLEERRLNCIKDDTDGVDALDVALKRGATEITFLGALGGRLDHAIANVMLLVRAHRQGAKARILSEDAEIWRVDGESVLRGMKGETISLLPLGEAEGVNIEGCFYPISDYTLTSDYPIGVSNVVTADEARVSVRKGDLILFRYQNIHGHGEKA